MPELYEFQKQAVYDLQDSNKHIVIAPTGIGKTIIALHWAIQQHKPKCLVVTTPSARDSKQWYQECEVWCKESLSSSSLEVISWQALAKWTISNWNSLDNYTFIFDEVAKAKAGTSSARGRAFLQITKSTDCWAGFTATPGDRWIDFQAYLIAGGYVKNKTQFMHDFCQVQTFKGYPEIVGYRDEHLLRRWWAEMTVCPDTTQLQQELPPERHFTHHFKADPYYKTLLRTHTLKDGTFLDTTGAFCAACRRFCFTKGKQQWLADYLEGLDCPTVLFYALTETGDRACEVAAKSLPADAHVWRICGKTHDIPTADTIGKHDVVVCQWEAGSEALNLQFIHEWVSLEPCYSYSTSIQARGRVKRKGQTHLINYHYLKCPDTIEDSVYEALENKSEFSERNWVLKEGE